MIDPEEQELRSKPADNKGSTVNNLIIFFKVHL